MCRTPPYTRHKTKTNKTKTQHNMWWIPPYISRRQKKTQHNMCWIPPYISRRQT
jgi:hypothetical protein